MLSLSSIVLAQETTKTIDNYTTLIVSRGVDVRLIKSPSNEVKITTKGIKPNEVVIENHGDELIIKVSTKSLWLEMQDNYWWARIELPYQTIDNIEVSTGAKITSLDLFKGDLLDLEVSMGGELELEVDLNELILDSNMGSVAEIVGRAEIVELSASMGAEIDLRDLQAEIVTAKSSMGAEVRVHANKEFSGRANMGGSIRVTGNPEKFYESTSMGGDIYASEHQ